MGSSSRGWKDRRGMRMRHLPPTSDSSCAGPRCVGAGFLYEVSSLFGAGRWPVSPAAAPLDSNVHSHASAFRLRDEVRAPTRPRLFHHSMLASLKSVLTPGSPGGMEATAGRLEPRVWKSLLSKQAPSAASRWRQFGVTVINAVSGGRHSRVWIQPLLLTSFGTWDKFLNPKTYFSILICKWRWELIPTS